MFQLNQASCSSQAASEKQQELNGFIANSPIYVTSLNGNGEATAPSATAAALAQAAPLQPPLPNGHPQDNNTNKHLVSTSVIIETKANHVPSVAAPTAQQTPVKQLLQQQSPATASVGSAQPSVGYTNSISDNNNSVVVNSSEVVTSPVPAITNGRTEKLLGDQPDNRRTSIAELGVTTDAR